MQGIFLGLSTGLSCLGSCGPVFVPLIMSENRRLKQCARVLGELAFGRLIAYLIFGAGIGYIGMRIEGLLFQKAIAGAMIILSALLILFAVTRGFPHLSICRVVNKRQIRYPIIFGLLTGFNVCPPFLLATSRTFDLASISKGIFLFAGFFAGTSVYLVLLLPLGFLGRWQNIRIIGVLTAMLSGVYFLFMGIIRLIAL